MKKPESKLWQNLRDGTKHSGVFWTRLESWATPGIPDCHGIIDGFPFWLELKLHSLKSLNYVNLSPHQISFAQNHSHASVWLLVWKNREYYLYPAAEVIDVADRGLHCIPLIKSEDIEPVLELISTH